MILHLDLETKSPTDLPKCGVYRYAEDAEIIVAAWAVDDGPVHVWHHGSGEVVPDALFALLRDPTIIKMAHNANFERTLINACWGIECPPEQWRCTQVLAYANGLPGSLGETAEALSLQDKKGAVGKKLIRLFSMPQKPTKKQPKVWLNHTDRPDDWTTFVEYCRQDVVVERAIYHKLQNVDLPAKEWELWCMDQRANDLGIGLDRRLVEQAIAIDTLTAAALVLEAERLTGLDNPNSVAQLKGWLLAEHDETVESLNKVALADLTNRLAGTPKRVMEIRQQLGKASVKKYRAMLASVCRDGRVRGLLQFYGAARTGRWAGRLIQVQNLPRSSIEDLVDLDAARNLVLAGDAAGLDHWYDNVAQTLADLVRTALVAESGSRLIVCDESAIEARVLAWLAGEDWRLRVFRTHGKIYEASASEMFKVPLELIKKGNPEYALRQKGKVAELALGYQGGPGALITMGALSMGLKEDELPALVASWRKANPAIVRFWYTVGDHAKDAIKNPGTPVMRRGYGFVVEAGVLFMILPNGRRLAYRNVALEDGRIAFDGLDQKTKKWGRIETYGGKLVENLTQAIARDCLAEAMIRMRDAGYAINMTVHDEVVSEMPICVGSIEEVERLMGLEISWAKGLPLRGAGFESSYYRKE